MLHSLFLHTITLFVFKIFTHFKGLCATYCTLICYVCAIKFFFHFFLLLCNSFSYLCTDMGLKKHSFLPFFTKKLHDFFIPFRVEIMTNRY